MFTDEEGHECVRQPQCVITCLFDFITRASTALKHSEDEKGIPLCADERRRVFWKEYQVIYATTTAKSPREPSAGYRMGT